MGALNRSGLIPLVGGCLTAAASLLGAQGAQSAMCFQARPLAECRAWIPFMVSTVVRVGASNAIESPFGYQPANQMDFFDFGAFDVGYMRNRDGSDAIGGLIEAGTGGFDKRFALKARGQRWLSRSWAVSASVGVVNEQQQAVAGNGVTHGHGATADVAIDAEDTFGALLTADVTHQSGHQTTTFRAGIRAGSYTAVAEAALLGLIYITIISPFEQRQP